MFNSTINLWKQLLKIFENYCELTKKKFFVHKYPNLNFCFKYSSSKICEKKELFLIVWS